METNHDNESSENITKTAITETEGYRTKQMFDVDLTEGYLNLEKILENVTLKPGAIPTDEYLRRSREMIEVVMNDQGRKMPERLIGSDYVIVDSSASNYVGALGFALISYDPIQIPLLLDYQKKIYKGPNVFSEIVGRTVLKYVLRNSPFDNEKRATIIRDWAREEEKIASGNVPKKRNKDLNQIIPLSSFMREPNITLINFLKEKVKDASPFNFVTLISALIRLEYIPKANIKNRSSFRRTCIKEFGSLCKKTTFNDELKILINNEGIRPPEENEWIRLIQDFLKSHNALSTSTK